MIDFFNKIQKLKVELRRFLRVFRENEQQMMMQGKILSEMVKSKKNIKCLHDVEFKVFSQCSDDGIIQWLIHQLEFPNKTFVEFGVEDYSESNTRFLMMNDNWSGLVMDGSNKNIRTINSSDYFWKYELEAKAVFVDAHNINSVLSSCELGKEVGILHIDIDGNDYWIWKEIDVISPVVVILEYNSVLGVDRAITIPYDKSFHRTRAHYSNLYYGASLPALYQLSKEKGYAFIGCNSAGNNAYFIRNDKLNDEVRAISLDEGYVLSKFRESRNARGQITCLTGASRIEAIRGMPVYNVNTCELEEL